MKNVKLCFAKQIFSVIAASSMMFGCGYVSAMKPEPNSLDSEFLDPQEKLINARDRCMSILRHDRVLFDQIRQIRIHFYHENINKTYMMNRNICTLTYEFIKSIQSLGTSMLNYWDVHFLIIQSVEECCNTILGRIDSGRGAVSENVIALAATTRCVTYSLVRKNLVKDLSIFISSAEKVAKLASTENLSSEAKKHLNDLQKLINDNTHLLNQIRELCKEKYTF